MRLPWRRRPDPRLDEISIKLDTLRDQLDALWDRLGGDLVEEVAVEPVPVPEPFFGQLSSKGGLGAAKHIYTDASIGHGRESAAWVGDDGSWMVSVRKSGVVDTNVAELRAIQLAVKSHSDAITIYTDNATAAQVCRFWSGIPVDNPPRTKVMESYRSKVPGLLTGLLARRDTVVHWMPRNQHPLHRGADRIAGLGTQNPALPPDRLWATADSVARYQAGVVKLERESGLYRLVDHLGKEA